MHLYRMSIYSQFSYSLQQSISVKLIQFEIDYVHFVLLIFFYLNFLFYK